MSDDIEEPLPPWATAHNKYHFISVGTQLLTKDGRRTGNARITNADLGCLGSDQIIYTCKTDMLNEIILTENEIQELFYIGDYFVELDPKIYKE